jgi:hypothetical protein
MHISRFATFAGLMLMASAARAQLTLEQAVEQAMT